MASEFISLFEFFLSSYQKPLLVWSIWKPEMAWYLKFGQIQDCTMDIKEARLCSFLKTFSMFNLTPLVCSFLKLILKDSISDQYFSSASLIN